MFRRGGRRYVVRAQGRPPASCMKWTAGARERRHARGGLHLEVTAGALGTLNGENKVGAWQLCIGDSVAADTGSLDGWTLTLGTTPVTLQSFSVD